MESSVEMSYDTFESGVDTRPDSSPIILMHGLFWNKFMLKDIARRLCEMTRRKVFSLDLRNHGESPRPDECDCVLMAEDVKRFMDVQHLKRVSFVCQSFSGTVAYLVALDRPESVEKMVMVDSAPFYEFSTRSIDALVAPQIAAQNKLLNILDNKMTLMTGKRKFYKLAEISPPTQASFYKKAAYDLTKSGGQFGWKIDLDFLMEKYRQKAFAIDPRGSSEHEILMVRCPGSVRVLDSKFDAILRFNPKAKLVTIPDTTHLLMFEKTEEFLDIVKNFLNGTF